MTHAETIREFVLSRLQTRPNHYHRTATLAREFRETHHPIACEREHVNYVLNGLHGQGLVVKIRDGSGNHWRIRVVQAVTP